MKRVATADSPNAPDRSANRAVFAHGEQHISAAGGMKSARAAPKWTQQRLVDTDQSNQRPRGKTDEGSPQEFHARALISLLDRASAQADEPIVAMNL